MATADRAVLKLIDVQRERLRIYTQTRPRRWIGSLRRLSFARAVRGSNSIEGYNATLDDAVAAVDAQPPLDPTDETMLALIGYRNALTYIIQTAADPYFELNKQFLKSLHFMMLSYDMSKNPGQYRPGAIHVLEETSGNIVYRGPDIELVDGLVSELISYLKEIGNSPLLVRAAMAHLNLATIHPFSDGNGRLARALQTFVLAREGIIDPVFASIEEWLGQNTKECYSVLAQVGQGQWSPQQDALPWVRFCLRAHFFQAARMIRRNDEYSVLYDAVGALVLERRLNERMILPLFDAALGLSLTNSRYVAAIDGETHTATRDLKQLVDSGLLLPVGERRGRKYIRSNILTALRNKSRLPQTSKDPYRIVAETAEGAIDDL